MKTLATTLLLLAALPTIAQEPPTVSLDAICKAADAVGETATRTEYEADPLAYADDFCALARYGGRHRAARQLSKAITVVRRFNNPNRYYFDPRRGSESGLYIQLLRPWMIEENKGGTADWQVIQATPGTLHGIDIFVDRILIIDRDDQKSCVRHIRIRLFRPDGFYQTMSSNKVFGYSSVWVDSTRESTQEHSALDIKNYIERSLNAKENKIWEGC